MNLTDCRYDGTGEFKIADYPTSAHIDKDDRDGIEQAMQDNIAIMSQLQDRLYAEAREGVVIMFQAMDAAGKDSTIKRVMTGLNPQGVCVHSFKQPSSEEQAHDYLWRAACHLPRRGYIGLFNRSYYEDVLVVRVHNMKDGYAMPARCIGIDEDEFFANRYRQIRDFERHLWENGYRLLKIMLNVSADEQRKRFLERIDDPAKNWKFSSGDLEERKLWPQYMEAYEQAIGNTATPQAPWYVIPADQKWYTRYLVSQAIVDVLESCDPQYPTLAEEKRAKLAEYRKQLS